METKNTQTCKVTFRCTAEQRADLAARADDCAISLSKYCRTLALGGQPVQRFTDEQLQILKDIAAVRGTLQKLNNYFGGRQYREVFEENIRIINTLNTILHDCKR